MKALGSRTEAFTRVELTVVVAVIAVLLFMLVPGTLHSRSGMPTRIACMNNLRQIGIAYRIWSNDHGDDFRHPRRKPTGAGVISFTAQVQALTPGRIM